MPFSEGIPSSPPGPGSSLEESLKFYKTQYELLETELADFQASSKDLEAELEKDIDAAEQRERRLKDKAANLQYEVDEWKSKHKQAKTEAASVQSALQKEITELRESNLNLQLRLRDIEVANDDYERKQRNTESSLEDMESKYVQAVERSVMLEEEVRTGEQEREALRIEAQRLRDELSDLRIETDITKEKLRKAEESLAQRGKTLTIQPVPTVPTSPRSELSPTTTTTSSPSFDTPPAKTASSSGLSDTPTPPSPPISERSAVSKPPANPTLLKTRVSMGTNHATLRQPATSAKPNGHARGASTAAISRAGSSSTFRQSLSKLPPPQPPRVTGLPQSSSIIHLRNLRGKMQKLEERVQHAKSRLPAPIHTPPRMSPRSGSALGNPIPSSVTVRSRKRNGGSTMSGPESLLDRDQDTPSVLRSRSSRPSLSQQQAPTPSRGDMAAPPLPRPLSRASGISSRASMGPHASGHQSRPSSRASVSGIRAPLGGGIGSNFAPNASTDRIRPKSSLSSYGYDGTLDEENNENEAPESRDFATPTPRRTTFVKRTSDVGSTIPSPVKRTSLGGVSKLPAPVRRQSTGFGRVDGGADPRPPSRQLNDVQEGYDLNETF